MGVLMYPFLRFAKEHYKFRNAPCLALDEVHVSTHRCWPIDIDAWVELNNGRTMTLLDLGRLLMFRRMGISALCTSRGWYLTVAGAAIRYRRRVRTFDRFEVESRLSGWDRRFFYVEQSMWRPDGACANNAVLRIAVASSSGIVDPQTVVQALPHPIASPALPDWVQSWSDAEALRPWPPRRHASLATSEKG